MNTCKRGVSILLVVVLVFGLISNVFAATYPAANDAVRHVVCSALSTQAEDYYTGSYSWENLSNMKGDNSGSSLKAMDSVLYQSLQSLMSSTQKSYVSYDNLKYYWPYTDTQAGYSTCTYLYSEGDTTSNLSREHVWPKSRASFYEKNGGCDLHHMRPEDAGINSARGNHTMGDLRSTGRSYTPKPYNGEDVLYYNTSLDLVEVNDNIKGDVARIMLYVYTRWGQPNLFEDVSSSNLPALDSDDDANNGLKVMESLNTLLQWCQMDPVDNWEMTRNDRCQDVQGNRNVFIDYPELAWILFGRTLPADMITPSGYAKQSGMANYEIKAVSNNTQWGTVGVEGYRIIAVPEDGYAVTGASVTPAGAAKLSQDGNVFTLSKVTANVTVTVNFAAKTPSSISYALPDGVIAVNGPSGGYLGDVIKLPTIAGTPDDTTFQYTFEGWVEVPVATAITDKESLRVYAVGEEYTITRPLITFFGLYSYTTSDGTGPANTFTLVTEDPANWAGEYVMSGLSSSGAEYVHLANGSSVGASAAAVTLANAGITKSANTLSGVTTNYVIVVEPVSDGVYSMRLKGSETDCYLAYTGTSNSLTTSATADESAQWELTCSAGDMTVTNVGTPARILRFNATSALFRCYKSGQTPVYFYRAAGSSTAYYVTVEDDTACVHETTELRNVVEPDCVTDGYTGDQVCTVCGWIVSCGQDVKAIGHNYECHADENVETYTCVNCGDTYQIVIGSDPTEPDTTEPIVGDTWVKVALADIQATDYVAITMTKDGTTQILPNVAMGTSNQPLAGTTGTISGAYLTTDAEPASIAWNLVAAEGGYYIMTGDHYLYATASNNGLRIGYTTAVWNVVDNYLSAQDTGGTARYVGVYNNQDWRCYNSPSATNIANQELGFWKLTGETPEPTEPEVTEPEVTEPEVTEPEVTEPEVTEPEVTEPEVTEPEVTEPVTGDGQWVKVTLAEIQADDRIAISMSVDAVPYILPNTATGSKNQPLAEIVGAIDGSTLLTDADVTAISWNLVPTEGGYYIVNGDSYLYVTATNNGVRIGSTAAVWNVLNNYLSASDGTTDRYLGVYNKTDWRCYTSTTNNIANQVLDFWKYTGESTEPTEPEPTEPDVTEPEVTEPEPTEPEVTEPVTGDGQWVKVDLADIQAGDRIAISMSADTVPYILPNTATGSKNQPMADITGAISGNVLSTSADVSAIAWNIVATEGGYYIMTGDSYLYVTATNNGVRIGSTAAVWNVVDNYLSASDGTTDRYLGVYNKTDWRCYTSTTTNIADQVLDFWKYTSDATEPEPTEPEPTEPEPTEPEPTEPEPTEPEPTEPEPTEPQPTEPEVTEPENPDAKNGIYLENGLYYYYINDQIQYAAGLVFVDGSYYYIRSGGYAAIGSYWVTNTNGITQEGFYIFAEDGKMILTDTTKTGIYLEDGKYYYYVEGEIQFGAGLVYVDGYYYYIRSGGYATIGEYYVSTTNGLLPEGMYTFGNDGRMIIQENLKNGIVLEDDGLYYYYIDGEIQYAAGLVFVDGAYYYIRSGGYAAIGSYWVTNTNGITEEGFYIFAEDGKMILTDTSKNGIYLEDGLYYYYKDGEIQFGAGLVLVDGAYYYIRSGGYAAIGEYYVAITNGLLPEGTYTFGEDGKMIR